LALSDRLRRPFLPFFGLMVPILVAGCGKAPPQIVEVEGIVLIDGVPVNHAQVRFVPSSIPTDALEYSGVGVTEKDGTFKLQCKGEPGACVGENQVLVTEAEFPRELMGESKQVALAKYIQSLGNRPLPRQYTNFTNNPLVVNVEPGKKSYKIELKR
jgi:hypothetical protein